MFWTLVSFFILLFVLSKWGLPPLLKILKQRDEMIKVALNASENSKQEAVKILEDARKQIVTEKQKARDEIYLEKQKTEGFKNRILEEARTEARNIIEDADITLARHRAEVVRELRAETADLVVETAKKFIRHKLNQKDQEAIFKESLTELEKAYGEKRI